MDTNTFIRIFDILNMLKSLLNLKSSKFNFSAAPNILLKRCLNIEYLKNDLQKNCIGKAYKGFLQP